MTSDVESSELMVETFQLRGRVCLVTAGSKGIGKAISELLAAMGADVILTYRSNPAEATTFAEELKARYGVRAAARPLEVTNVTEVNKLLTDIIDEYAELHILVNNAGITADSLLMRMTDQQWDDVLEINLKGQFLTSRAAAKLMIKQRWGRIINISSVVGVVGQAGQSNYAAAKSGIHGFSRALAQELAGRNITVNCVAPGYVETDMTAGLTSEQIAHILTKTPMGRPAKAGEIASLVGYLATDAAAYITGQVINVDGGTVTA